MIGKLTGLVDSTGEDWALIDVNGVGYVVFASGRTLGALRGRGEAAALLIETHVREDHIHLFGFMDAAERDWFRLLCTVQGVGAKMALAVLTVLDPSALQQAIAAQDKTALTRANGVGPKLAQRIVSELKEKAGRIGIGAAAAAAANGAAAPAAGGAEDADAADAVSALVNLGYGRSEAFGAVARAARAAGAEGSTVESLIKAGLKELTS